MTKKAELLKNLKKNLNKWVCVNHNVDSDQPASVFRELKNEGYKFKLHKAGQWAKRMYCKKCDRKSTHYKLISKKPKDPDKERVKMTKEVRKRIIKLLDKKDAITEASITSTPEVDHKTPWQRLEKDIDAAKLNDNELKEHFQLLTREHNTQKREKCISCVKTRIRPAFLGIPFWYKGDSKYEDTCDGCGWYDAKKWREVVKSKLI